MDRRQFIKSAAAVSVAASFPVLSRHVGKGRVLFLGGRGFLGPVIVNELLSQGYEVTLFNRGKTNPNLFPQLTWIQGDRETADGSGLANLRRHLQTQQYDWVIDTWQKSPLAVQHTAELLRGKVERYHYVSSIAVYRDMNRAGITEEYPLKPVEGLSLDSVKLRYSQRKTLAEQVLQRTWGERYCSFRAHGIKGERIPAPGDEPYWPARFNRGGEILLPKSADHQLQATDALSLARFMVLCGRQRLSGPFNVAYQPIDFDDYIGALTAVIGKDYQPVWIDEAFLAEQGIQPYRQLPFWRPKPVGFYQFDVSRALAAGLSNRPVAEMSRDQLEGYLARHPRDDFEFGYPGTISMEKEREVIARWRQQQG